MPVNIAELLGAAQKMTTKGEMPIILIADDNQALRTNLKNLLIKGSTGMRFIDANDGNEAVEYLTTTQKTPNLVVMDAQMPKMTGTRALKLVRKRFSKEKLPVVMLTDSNDRALIVELIQAGASEVIIKPFDNQTIAERLLKHIKVS
jgi:CheY-like chemotaxis protein